MPPTTGVASGFITSPPVRVDRMMGNRPATTVDTVIILGRKRSRAPSITASRRPIGREFCRGGGKSSCGRDDPAPHGVSLSPRPVITITDQLSMTT